MTGTEGCIFIGKCFVMNDHFFWGGYMEGNVIIYGKKG